MSVSRKGSKIRQSRNQQSHKSKRNGCAKSEHGYLQKSIKEYESYLQHFPGACTGNYYGVQKAESKKVVIQNRQ